MSTEYTIVIEKDEDGDYVGSVPVLPVPVLNAQPKDYQQENWLLG